MVPTRSVARARTGIAVVVIVMTIGAAGAALVYHRWFVAAVDLPRTADQNVLVVTIDTLRADALGCDGGPARTPNIDAVAAAGVRFTFAHAHDVVTLPSHASILTGTYPFQHGLRENSGYRLNPGVATIASLLKTHGFATGAFIGAFPLDARFGLTAGFDTYDGRFDDRSAEGFVIAERPATAVVARAQAWIRERSASRWFAWVHVYEPHAPYRPPPPFDREYSDRPYFGEVAAVDSALGPLFETARGGPRSTLVVITGDHGEALGDHGEATHGLFAYESTLRIPLIIAPLGPATASRPAVSDEPARHVDIVPTILDAVEIAVPPDLPGHSLRRQADRAEGAERPSYFESMSPMLDYGWAPLTGVLAGREKFIDLPLAELYDLAADPREQNNLGTRAAERLRVLGARLGAFHGVLPGAPGSVDPDVARRLQTLGYVSGGAAAKKHYSEDDDPKRLVEIDQQMHEAVALDENGRVPEAIERFRAVLTRRPDMLAAARRIAFDYWRTGNAAEAIAALESALRSSPEPGAEIQLGTYLLDAGRASEGLSLLKRAAEADPTLDALNALGLGYARVGRDDEALAAFERSLAIDPDNPATHENIGAIEMDRGQLAEARRDFERALRANDQSSSAHAGLATVAFKSGDATTAFAEWKRTVEIDPTNWDALYDLGVQLARVGRTKEARPYLERFVRNAPPAIYAKNIQNAINALR